MRVRELEFYFVAVQHEHRNIGEALPWYSHDIVAGPFINRQLAIAEGAKHTQYAADQMGSLVVCSATFNCTDFYPVHNCA